MTAWTLLYESFEPDHEGVREALCTLGNGYFATRGAAPEAEADGVHYPGTYAAGGYNRMSTEIAGHTVENEDLVNMPNWLPFTFRIDRGPWFGLGDMEILSYRQELDLRRGVLTRLVRVRDDEGRVTSLTQRRFVHMREPHLAGLESTLLAENWSGSAHVRSALDGRVRNTGVARYRDLRSDHLVPLEQGAVDDESVYLVVETLDSHLRVAEAARTRVLQDERTVEARRVVEEPGYIGHELELDLEEGVQVTVEKIVAFFTSRDRAVYEPGVDAREKVGRAASFDTLLERHVVAWDHLWRRFDIELDGDAWSQMVLRLHVFHLLQTVSENSIGLDVGVPARGLHGEAYRGHIFWDELFVFPFLNYRLPALTRTLLEYRARRLGESRWAARQAGYDGAMYPWQSGSTGREESQKLHLNPRSGRWIPDNSHRQRHINIAIVWNIWQYYQVTCDRPFLRHRAAPMIVEIARFWSSLSTYNRSRDRYEIRGVMGPDEYHDAYPDRAEPGLDNNAYTNVMVVWVLTRALELPDVLAEHQLEELWTELALSQEELDRWEEITRKMFVPHHDGVISQFEGYETLEEFDWEGYRDRYGDIQRLDRILEAEGDSTNRYKASKQADVLMLFYLLSSDELAEIFGRLGYGFEPDKDVRLNTDYYLERTSHGSTLSRIVHSRVLARSDPPRSWELFVDALRSDVEDIQGGTTAEGIHLGAMAGTVDLVQRGLTGLEVREDVLWFDPALPEEIPALRFQMHYRGHRLRIEIDADRICIHSRPAPADPIRIGIAGDVTELRPGGRLERGFPPRG